MDVQSDTNWIAGFWKRIGAFLIDTMFLGVVGLGLGYFYTDYFVGLGVWGRLVGFSIALLYFALFNSYLGKGQTLGKRLLKLRVVDELNNTVSLPRSIARYCILGVPFFLNGAQFQITEMQWYAVTLLCVVVFGAGISIVYLYIFNRKTRQSLHDLVCKTYVVNVQGIKHEIGKPTWFHIPVVACLFVASAVAPAIIKLYIPYEGVISKLLDTQQGMMKRSEVAYATVSEGFQASTSTNDGNNAVRYVSANIFLKENRVNDQMLARDLAMYMASVYPDAKKKDVLRINLVYGYDIGIANKWKKYHFEFTPCDIAPDEPVVESEEALAKMPERLRLLKAGDIAALEAFYSELQSDYESGKIDETALYDGFKELYASNEGDEKNYSDWVGTHPQSYAAVTARGAYYFRMAGNKRGGEFIGNTPACKLQKMHDYLVKAQSDLVASEGMTAKPLMSVLYRLNAVRYEGSLAELRILLEKGNSIAPNNWRIRYRYMTSIVPRWYGNYQMMQDFLAECKTQGVSEEHLAMLESEIYADKLSWEKETTAKNAAYEKLKAIIANSQAHGWDYSDNAMEAYARAALERKQDDEAIKALTSLVKHNNMEPWIYSNLGFIYIKRKQMQDAWTNVKIGASLNDPWSEFSVGKTLYLGCVDINLAPDKAAGLAMMKRSAAHGFDEAKQFLIDHQQ